MFVMTTITVHQKLDIGKTEFRNLAELIGYLRDFVMGNGDESVTEFGVLSDDEVTPEMRAKMEETKKLYKTNPERFIDIR